MIHSLYLIYKSLSIMDLQKIPNDILFSEFKRRYHCSQINDPKKIVLLGSIFNSDLPAWAKAPNPNFYKNDSACAPFPPATSYARKSLNRRLWA